MSIKKFEEYIDSYVKEFNAQKDRLKKLLPTTYHYEIGRHREIILSNFLKKYLPKNITVGTGFIYGGTEELTSKQIDILIYDNNYCPIFIEGDFVVIIPESVIAVIEVKSSLNKTEIIGKKSKYGDRKYGALDLINKVCEIERKTRKDQNPKILKVIIGYKRGRKIDTILQDISDYYRKTYIGEKDINEIMKVPQEERSMYFVDLVATIDNGTKQKMALTLGLFSKGSSYRPAMFSPNKGGFQILWFLLTRYIYMWNKNRGASLSRLIMGIDPFDKKIKEYFLGSEEGRPLINEPEIVDEN